MRAKELHEQELTKEVHQRTTRSVFKGEAFWRWVLGIFLAGLAVFIFCVNFILPVIKAKDEIQNELQEVNERKVSIEAEIDVLKDRRTGLEADNKYLQADIGVAKAEQRKSKLQGEYDELEREYGALKLQMDSRLQQERELRQNEATRYKDEIELRNKRIEEIQRERIDSAQKNKELEKEIADRDKTIEALAEINKRGEQIQKELVCDQDSIRFVVYKLGTRDPLPEDYQAASAERKREVCWRARDKENVGAPVWLTPQGLLLLACYCG